MGSDTEPDPYSTPKLPLFSISPPHHSEPSGTLTPPLQTTASVPFRWEEQPGKPRPCTDIIIAPTNRPEKCLDLPPRLAVLELSNIVNKTTSPTTVLDGKSVFSTSSFRFAKERSFDSNGSGGWSPIDGRQGQEVLLLQGEGSEGRNGGRCYYGSFRVKSGTRKWKSSSLISPSSTSSMETGFFEDEKKKMRRNSSLSKVTRSHFWATIYEGFKQVVPWRKRPGKESFSL